MDGALRSLVADVFDGAGPASKHSTHLVHRRGQWQARAESDAGGVPGEALHDALALRALPGGDWTLPPLEGAMSDLMSDVGRTAELTSAEQLALAERLALVDSLDESLLRSALDLADALVKAHQTELAHDMIVSLLPFCRDQGGIWLMKALSVNAAIKVQQSLPREALEMLREYETLITLSPEEAWEIYDMVYRNLGRVHSDLQEYQQALGYFRRCVEVKKSNGCPVHWLDQWDIANASWHLAESSGQRFDMQTSLELMLKAIRLHRDVEHDDGVTRISMLRGASQCAVVAANSALPVQLFGQRQLWGKAEAGLREAHGTCLREFGAEEPLTLAIAEELATLLDQRGAHAGVAGAEAEVWEEIEVWEDLTERESSEAVPADPLPTGLADVSIHAGPELAEATDVTSAVPLDVPPLAASVAQAAEGYEEGEEDEEEEEEEEEEDGHLQLQELQIAVKDVSMPKQQCVWHCLTPGASSTCEALEAEDQLSQDQWHAVQSTLFPQQGKTPVSWCDITPQGTPQLDIPNPNTPQTACGNRRTDCGASAGDACRNGDRIKLASSPGDDVESPCSTFDGTSPASNDSSVDAPAESLARVPIRQAWDFPLSTHQKRLRLAYLFDQERVAVTRECRTLRRRLSASCDGRRSHRSSLSSRDSGSRRCSVGSLEPPVELQGKNRRSRSPLQVPASF